MRRVVESRRDRMGLAHDAGLGSVSFVSVLAGMLVAYGAFAVIAAVAGGVLGAVGVDTTELTTNDWRELGIGSGVAVALTLFVSYFFGGYVAGRMARRAGAVNGLLVFLLGVLVAVGVGAAIGTQADTGDVVSNLRSIGVPTSAEEWSAIGTGVGIAALAAILLGSLLGGITGERWHGKLLARAMDPTIGPEADARTTTRTRADDDIDLRDRTPATSATDDDADYRARHRLAGESDAELAERRRLDVGADERSTLIGRKD